MASGAICLECGLQLTYPDDHTVHHAIIHAQRSNNNCPLCGLAVIAVELHSHIFKLHRQVFVDVYKESGMKDVRVCRQLLGLASTPPPSRTHTQIRCSACNHWLCTLPLFRLHVWLMHNRRMAELVQVKKPKTEGVVGSAVDTYVCGATGCASQLRCHSVALQHAVFRHFVCRFLLPSKETAGPCLSRVSPSSASDVSADVEQPHRTAACDVKLEPVELNNSADLDVLMPQGGSRATLTEIAATQPPPMNRQKVGIKQGRLQQQQIAGSTAKRQRVIVVKKVVEVARMIKSGKFPTVCNEDASKPNGNATDVASIDRSRSTNNFTSSSTFLYSLSQVETAEGLGTGLPTVEVAMPHEDYGTDGSCKRFDTIDRSSDLTIPMEFQQIAENGCTPVDHNTVSQVVSGGEEEGDSADGTGDLVHDLRRFLAESA